MLGFVGVNLHRNGQQIAAFDQWRGTEIRGCAQIFNVGQGLDDFSFSFECRKAVSSLGFDGCAAKFGDGIGQRGDVGAFVSAKRRGEFQCFASEQTTGQKRLIQRIFEVFQRQGIVQNAQIATFLSGGTTEGKASDVGWSQRTSDG